MRSSSAARSMSARTPEASAMRPRSVLSPSETSIIAEAAGRWAIAA